MALVISKTRLVYSYSEFQFRHLPSNFLTCQKVGKVTFSNILPVRASIVLMVIRHYKNKVEYSKSTTSP